MKKFTCKEQLVNNEEQKQTADSTKFGKSSGKAGISVGSRSWLRLQGDSNLALKVELFCIGAGS